MENSRVMEIERKWMPETGPEGLERYSHADIVQGYISTDPTIRIRKGGASYRLTIKGQGTLSREEYELPISAESFGRLLKKCEGRLIEKTRYFIPVDAAGGILNPGAKGTYTAELDIFTGHYAGLIYVEIEFGSVEEAESFAAPAWFGKEVTGLPGYSNGDLSLRKC